MTKRNEITITVDLPDEVLQDFKAAVTSRLEALYADYHRQLAAAAQAIAEDEARKMRDRLDKGG